MNAGHTPGPWEFSDDLILCGDPDAAVGSAFPMDRDGTRYAYGDVLLEALEHIVGLTGYANCDSCNDVNTAARAAIAKATGASA